MDFSWPIEIQRRVDDARRFAEEHLAQPCRSTGFDSRAFRAAAEFGVFGLALPKAWGGEGAGALATVAVMDAFGRGGADRGLLFAMGAHLFGCAMPIALHGTPRDAEAYGEGLRTGAMVGALAITEAACGSSFDLMTTSATETAGGYVLNGEKTLISNAGIADVFLVLTKQFPDKGSFGLTAFVVPNGLAGLMVTPIAAAKGMPGSPMGNVRFENCLMPADAMLGSPGAGLKVFMTSMQWERSCILAGFLGAAERDLAACIHWLQSRGDGRGPLYRHQAVAHKLARVKLAIESARLVLYRAAWAIDQGRADVATASMAKLAVSEAVVAAASDCMRLMAGTGWRGAAPIDINGALDDALGTLFASGTSEVQLDIMARQLQVEYRRK
jgi:alkylation response protein AidB-like acyl-CoA dehydrogenase